jgi:LPPG:FO 2-phospho-L-lactate transferase
MMIAVLSGGTGTPKFLQGLVRVVDPRELAVIVNTAEDTWVSGLHVSPDIDTVVYTLAGIVNESTWYGIRGDTFHCHEMLRRLGHREILRIGDRDRAVKLWRTLLLGRGFSLSAATQRICRALGIRARVMPMSDDPVQTEIVTPTRTLSFHEFWVAKRGRARVVSVRFKGIEKAKPAPGVIRAIRKSRAIIIGPSNPVTSIGPILRIGKIKESLIANREKVVAVSPIIGNAPISGPAGKLMRALGYEVGPLGVATIYSNCISALVVDRSDSGRSPEIRSLGIRPVLAHLRMNSMKEKVELARRVLTAALGEGA